MSLLVEPWALSGYARQIHRATDDAGAVQSYVTKHTEGATGGELIEIANEGHQHAVGIIDGALKRLVQILQASAPELDAAATYYRQTDLAAAAAVDRTMPQTLGQCPTTLEYEFNSMVCKPVDFTDPRLVTGRLKPPPEPATPHNALGFMDYVSPTSWAMKGCDIVLGFDPVSWLQERFAGDWEALASMDAVLGNAAEGLHDLAFNIQSGVTTVHPKWQGNAGDAAYEYFTDLATSIVALEAPLREIGHAYKVMADAVWAAGEALGGIIKGLLDAAIIAGISAAAGTATSWTGVGAAAGYGIAAVEVANMLRLWGDATKLYQHAGAAVLTFRSALNNNLSDLNAVTLPTLSGGAGYDHPTAQPAQVR